VFTDTEVQLKVKAKLTPQPGVSKDDLLDVGLRATDAFRSHYDSKLILTDNANGKQLLLRCVVAFVDSGEHLAIKVYPGGNVSTGGGSSTGSLVGRASFMPTSWVISSG
jgi:hypothetical protein